MSEWVSEIENTIFSLVKSKTYDGLSEKYPNIRFTTEETASTTTKFPNIYIHIISINEEGMDLQGESINAVLASVQVDVTTNTKKGDASDVIYTIVDALKELRFYVTSLPIFTTEDDVHRAIVRARRMIGSGDIL